MKYTLECVRAHTIFTPASHMIGKGLDGKDVVLCDVPAYRFTRETGQRFTVKTKKEVQQWTENGLWKVV
jgi:hypothetical protein